MDAHRDLLVAVSRTASFALALVLLAPGQGWARDRPTVATDAFMIGTRLSPGAALVAAWDLDVYLSRDRAVSLGPSVSVAVLGPAARNGAEQKLLIAVDVGRLKIGLNEAGGEWRPYLMFGGGFAYVHLPAQVDTGVEFTTPEAPGTIVTGDRHFGDLQKFLGILSFGAGTDLFVGGPWALTLAMTTHVRLGKTARVPEVWEELAAGIRFGL